MKAFVTGGTGFIGINLIHLLAEKGWEITVLHRKTSNLNPVKLPGIQFQEGDVTNFASIIKAIPEGTDVIFNLAASTNTWSKNNKQQTEINNLGTQNMVNAALQKKVKRFIHTSSIVAYGIHDAEINENTPSNAEKLDFNYSITKFQSEQIVKNAVKKGLDAVILNPANVIGPYDYQNWVRMFLIINEKGTPGVPSGKASFCYVKDVANAHISAFKSGKIGENYLLGGPAHSYIEVINKIETLLNKKVSQKVTPDFLLKVFAGINNSISAITSKKPTLTPEEVILLTARMTCKSQKAVADLNYKISDLDFMLQSTFEWLKSEKKI
ncbi:MAG: NAD-dependent epimerase/dehydratase family protein [Chitinophagaceae bacterium]|nr:MAG: NAD-dependent epimerase/dehydratase family protein [Chitinophagaceae bacterium]